MLCLFFLSFCNDQFAWLMYFVVARFSHWIIYLWSWIINICVSFIITICLNLQFSLFYSIRNHERISIVTPSWIVRTIWLIFNRVEQICVQYRRRIQPIDSLNKYEIERNARSNVRETILRKNTTLSDLSSYLAIQVIQMHTLPINLLKFIDNSNTLFFSLANEMIADKNWYKIHQKSRLKIFTSLFTFSLYKNPFILFKMCIVVDKGETRLKKSVVICYSSQSCCLTDIVCCTSVSPLVLGWHETQSGQCETKQRNKRTERIQRGHVFVFF